MDKTTQIDLTPYRMHDGKLASHTSLGSYPLIYVTKSGETLCAACAEDSDPEMDPIVAADVHWEGPAEICYCGKKIESAYGDPDKKEG